MTRHDDWTNAQESQEVTVDGHDLEMTYYDEGEGDPVVLLHGIPTWSYLWRDVADALADDPSEEFVEGTKSPWDSEEGLVSLVRDAAATNTNHTTELDPSEVTADALLLWGADDEFQPIDSAHRLDEDIDSSEVVGIDDANHWVLQDRPDRYADELRSFLVGESA
ncbi:alpha/beta fold hydrolase [Halorussus ruber]|uniref:alpha/beta fold hydrolase n=1 Tax=Halorussus ruber TaxID=1126238 RepID=UPI001091DE50|nr:hypothetical protein [Halorussus ruber]